MRRGYSRCSTRLLEHRFAISHRSCCFLALGGVHVPFVGRDFFPAIDGGQIQLHVRAPPERGSRRRSRSSRRSRTRSAKSFPRSDRDLIVDNIGLPARAYNLAFTDGSTIGVNDGVILVSLKEGHAPTAEYVRKLRAGAAGGISGRARSIFRRPTSSPRSSISACRRKSTSAPSAMTGPTNLRIAKELRRRIAAIPGIADAHLQQEVDAPAFYADIDRARAAQLGLNADTIATNVNVSLSSSEQVTPNFWTDPQIGNSLLYRGADAREQDQLARTISRNTPVSTAISARRRRAGAGAAQQRRDLQARQRADQRQPGQHPAGL